MLSSCQANWFGSHFDVPWYFIAVPVFVLFIVLYVIIVSKTYVCPKCKTEFKPKWYQIYITIHYILQSISMILASQNVQIAEEKDFVREKISGIFFVNTSQWG